ncbi:MAG: hypothetical protein ACR2LT_05055 [Pyrinomonadaceae bacterium]
MKIKTITFAATRGVKQSQETVADLMLKIFDFKEEQYFVSDESSLWDFPGSMQEILNRIQLEYDVDISDIKDGNLVKICE